MGRKKKNKDFRIIQNRRHGDFQFTKEVMKSIDNFIRSRCPEDESVPVKTQLKNVRLILLPINKLIVVERTANVENLFELGLAKLGKSRKQFNSIFYLQPNQQRLRLLDTLKIDDDTSICFDWVDENLGLEEEEESVLDKKKKSLENEISSSEEDDDNDLSEQEEEGNQDEGDEQEGVEEEENSLNFFERIQKLVNQSSSSQMMKNPIPLNIENFAEMKAKHVKLPIDVKEKDIVHIVQNHSVTIVRAPTGSGKSTRIVQFLLESFPTGQYIVTEPRRIAAISLCDRVSEELGGSKAGEWCGYSVRTESKFSEKTRILFCTVGVLLRRLVHDPQLDKITHVLVDEAHERDVLVDTLLLYLKELILNKRPDLKLVILSATLQSSAFLEYFSHDMKVADIDVDGMTYPVESYFLETALHDVGMMINDYKTENHCLLISKLVERFIKRKERTTNKLTNGKKSILIFVAGKSDINKVISRLEHDLEEEIEAYPLHSALSTEEQRRVFAESTDCRKTRVIVSTNIAETSVTIDDVGLVIDDGYYKESTYDADSRTWHLQRARISKSAMLQRRGRAGRTSPGIAYHLFSESLELESHPLPGMLKDWLGDAIFHMKTVQKNTNAYEFLSKAISPPKQNQIQRILEDLVELGALRGNFNSINIDSTELTPLGYHLSKFGTNCRTGKLLLFGCFFQCLDPVLTIASVLDGKLPFKTNFETGKNKKSPQNLSKVFGQDDFASFILARKVYLSKEKDSRKSFLSATAMRLNELIRKDFVKDLVHSGFIDGFDTEKYSSRSDDMDVIRICLAAGLFPNTGRILHDGSIVSGPHQLLKSSFDKETFYQSPTKLQFFAYHERVRLDTNVLSVRFATSISPIALALFGGGFVKIRSRKKLQTRFVTIRVGNCWYLKCRIKEANLLLQLRQIVDETFLNVYEKQTLDVKDEELLDLVREIIL